MTNENYDRGSRESSPREIREERRYHYTPLYNNYHIIETIWRTYETLEKTLRQLETQGESLRTETPCSTGAQNFLSKLSVQKEQATPGLLIYYENP